jgi:CxxC motif-containing protein
MNKQLICIVCPKGCKVTVSEENGVYTTTGNACIRGNTYGIQEVIAPKRMLTSTIKIHKAAHSRCPVVSSGPIAKGDFFKVLALLETVEVTAPVTMKSIVLDNVLNSGIDILISRSMEETV